MEALPYYKWHWQAWRANRRVQRMSWQARGLYRELLDDFWAEGSLPDDLAYMAEVCGCPIAVMEEFWPEISPCFEKRDDRLFNRKMDEQRTAKDLHRVSMANAGRAGAFAKISAANDEHKPSISLANAGKSHIEREKRREEKREYAPTSQGESKPDERIPFGTIPCSGAVKTFAFYQEDVDGWQATFPGIDVVQQLRQCRQWNIDNPKKRKTANGMRRSINSWLTRAQDAPKPYAAAAPRKIIYSDPEAMNA